MKTRRTILLFFIFVAFCLLLFVSQAVTALQINSYTITAEPIGTAYVENNIELIVTNDESAPLNEGALNLAKETEVLSIEDSFGEISYDIEEKEETNRIAFTFTTPIEPGETRTITLKTKTYNIVQKEAYIEYILVLVPRATIEEFTHILKLDKDVELYDLESQPLIVPNAEITQTEEYLLIEWNTALTQEVPMVFLTRFDQEYGTNWWKIVGVTLLALFAGALAALATNKVYDQHKKKVAMNAANILNVREKRVLEYIIKNAPVKQYELVKKLGYTKSNMSKILKRLELRGVIGVKKEGKVRIIQIGETIRKKL